MKQFLIVVTALLFTSCSGGSSQDAKTLSASPSQIFITRVIDGYISGANIFIDHNWNLVQDADEPSAYEDTENNRYYFEESQFAGINNWSIECSRNRPRVAEIPVGAMDSERGEVTSEYKLYYFPYFGNSNGQQGLQGEYRANVTPLTSLFLGYVNNLLGDGSISAIDGCGSDGNLIAERVITEVQDVLRQLNDRFEVNVYSFYDDFIASNDEELQAFGEQIVDFLKITNQVSFLLENEYDINLRTALDIALVETILKKEDFDTVKFHLFSDSPQELLADGFFTYDIYMFGSVVADSKGNLLDQNNNIYDLTLDNLKLNSNFKVRNIIHSHDEIFDGIKVLFEQTESPVGTEWHIDYGTFAFEDDLVRISKNSSKRYIWNKIQFGLRLDFANPSNPYFDYDFERIFATRDPGELETIYNEIIAPSFSMESVSNNRYLLFEGDYQGITTQDWRYYEHQNTILELSCINNLSNETVYGADAFTLCSQHID
jgi:hypothetical protein